MLSNIEIYIGYSHMHEIATVFFLFLLKIKSNVESIASKQTHGLNFALKHPNDYYTKGIV